MQLEERAAFDNPAIPLSQAFQLFSTPSASGYPVTRPNVLAIPAFRRAVSLVANSCAKLPLHIYERDSTGGRRVYDNHPAYQLIHKRPSEYTSKTAWIQSSLCDVLIHGNSYAFITKSGAVPTNLTRLDPEQTRPLYVNGRLFYASVIDGKQELISPEFVLHFKGIVNDGIYGVSLLDSMKDSLGLSLSLTRFAATYFRNNATPGIVIEVPGGFKSQDDRDKFAENIRQAYTHDGVYRPLVLPNGAKASVVTHTPESSQLIDERKFSLIDIANAVGISAQRLGAEINTSYNSLLSEKLSFLDDIEPYLQTIEEECDYKLLTSDEYKNDLSYVEFDRSEMQKADPATEELIWTDRLTNGKATLNQYNDAHNLPRIDDEFGDWHRMPTNIAYIETQPEPAPAPGQDTPPTAPGSPQDASAPSQGQDAQPVDNAPQDAAPAPAPAPAPVNPAPGDNPPVNSSAPPDRSVTAPTMVQSLQQSVYAGSLPRLAAMANVQLLLGFSPQEAASLFPEVEVKAPAPAPVDPTAQAQRFNDLVSRDVDRLITRIRKAIEGKADKPDFQQWITHDFEEHRKVCHESLPFATRQLDKFLDELVEECKIVLPEQIPAVLSRINSQQLKEEIWN